MVERDRLQLGESLGTISIAEDDWELVAGEFRAALSQDRRTTGPAQQDALYYWLLLAEGHSHAGVFWQHASKDRGAAAAGRVANQERQRIGRSEVIQWGEVVVGR